MGKLLKRQKCALPPQRFMSGWIFVSHGQHIYDDLRMLRLVSLSLSRSLSSSFPLLLRLSMSLSLALSATATALPMPLPLPQRHCCRHCHCHGHRHCHLRETVVPPKGGPGTESRGGAARGRVFTDLQPPSRSRGATVQRTVKAVIGGSLHSTSRA